MKKEIIKFYKAKGSGALIPLVIYFILLIPISILYAITWILKPIEPVNLDELDTISIL